MLQEELNKEEQCPKCEEHNECFGADPFHMEGSADTGYDIRGWTVKFHCKCGEYYNRTVSHRVERNV